MRSDVATSSTSARPASYLRGRLHLERARGFELDRGVLGYAPRCIDPNVGPRELGGQVLDGLVVTRCRRFCLEIQECFFLLESRDLEKGKPDGHTERPVRLLGPKAGRAARAARAALECSVEKRTGSPKVSGGQKVEFGKRGLRRHVLARAGGVELGLLARDHRVGNDVLRLVVVWLVRRIGNRSDELGARKRQVGTWSQPVLGESRDAELEYFHALYGRRRGPYGGLGPYQSQEVTRRTSSSPLKKSYPVAILL